MFDTGRCSPGPPPHWSLHQGCQPSGRGRHAGRGKPCSDAGEQALERLSIDRQHQTFKSARRRENDTIGKQQGLRPFDQLNRSQTVGGEIGQAIGQARCRIGGECGETEVVAHPRTNSAVGGLPMQGQQLGRWLEPDLLRHVDDGFVRNALRVLDEATALAKAAQMQGGPQAALGTPRAIDFPKVGCAQGPLVENRIGITVIAPGGRGVTHQG